MYMEPVGDRVGGWISIGFADGKARPIGFADGWLPLPLLFNVRCLCTAVAESRCVAPAMQGCGPPRRLCYAVPWYGWRWNHAEQRYEVTLAAATLHPAAGCDP